MKPLTIIKDAAVLGVVVSIISLNTYGFLEPQIISAVEDQTVITLSVTSEITISNPGNITMSPSIAGLTGGSATGTATWTVVTNDSSGFSVTHKASSTAMLGNTQGDQFDAYTPAVAGTPDYTWSVAASAAEFGYSVISYDDPTSLASTFKDSGSACNTGSNVTYNRCFKDASTTAETIFNRSSETSSGGSTFTIDYKAESGSSAFTAEDTYTATTTLTAVTN